MCRGGGGRDYAFQLIIQPKFAFESTKFGLQVRFPNEEEDNIYFKGKISKLLVRPRKGKNPSQWNRAQQIQ